MAFIIIIMYNRATGRAAHRRRPGQRRGDRPHAPPAPAGGEAGPAMNAMAHNECKNPVVNTK